MLIILDYLVNFVLILANQRTGNKHIRSIRLISQTSINFENFFQLILILNLTKSFGIFFFYFLVLFLLSYRCLSIRDFQLTLNHYRCHRFQISGQSISTVIIEKKSFRHLLYSSESVPVSVPKKLFNKTQTLLRCVFIKAYLKLWRVVDIPGQPLLKILKLK